MKHKHTVLSLALAFCASLTHAYAQTDCATLAKAADTQIAEKDLRAAITTCNTALNTCKTGDWYARRGKLLLQLKDPQHATADLAEAIRLLPDDALLYAERGLAYAQTGDTDASRNDFNKAIDLAGVSLAPVVLRLRDEAEEVTTKRIAEQKTEEKTEQKTEQKQTNAGQGDNTRTAKQTEDIADSPIPTERNLPRKNASSANPAYNENRAARAAAPQTVRATGSFSSPACREAFLLAHNGNFMAAKRAAQTVLRQQPTNPEAYRVLGYVAAQEGNRATAIRHYSTALHFNPNDAVAYTQRGLQYGILGDNAQSLRDYNTALQIDPEDKDALYLRGVYNVTASNRRRQQQGCTDLAQAAQLGMPKAQTMLLKYCR